MLPYSSDLVACRLWCQGLDEVKLHWLVGAVVDQERVVKIFEAARFCACSFS